MQVGDLVYFWRHDQIGIILEVIDDLTQNDRIYYKVGYTKGEISYWHYNEEREIEPIEDYLKDRR
tara:strand:- start:1361 stop:1555 length:195 start_codon:yes stop_codon:yes gene_type:complete